MPAAPLADAVDCDVHVAPKTFEPLLPYLSDYWKQYIEESSVTLMGMPTDYPPAAGDPPARSYEELAERYLDVARPRTAVLTCLTHFEAHRNPYWSAAIATAVNEWVRDEFLARDERLRGQIAISPIAPEDAVTEIERVADDARFVSVLLPARTDLPWGSKTNQPVLAAAAAAHRPVTLHAFGRAGKAPTPSGFTTTWLENYAGNAPIAQAQLVAFVTEGVFERFPDLKVLVAESGFAWLPTLLWRFDKDWKGVWREVPWVKQEPSAYVARHFTFTTAPAHLPTDPVMLDQLIQMLGGTSMLAYASDFPHEHGAGIEPLLELVDDDAREALLRGTAGELFGLGAAQPV
jgi:uncharacterized protein